jgi:hypothetical protein
MPPPTPAPAAPFIKWEYARLESGPDGVGVVFTHREPWTGLPPEAFFDTLRRLGDEGWELVSAVPLAAGADFETEPRPNGPTLQRMRLRLDTDRWLVFKRPQPLESEPGPQSDLIKDLVQRQLLKGRLPFP